MAPVTAVKPAVAGGGAVRALIIYFSVSGSTERVTRRIAAGLEAAGFHVALHDLRRGPAPVATGFDLVGIGFPVHWYRMPVPVRDAFRSLVGLCGLPAFIFTLNATYRGAALNQARSALKRTGAREVGVFTCRGEGLFFGYSLLGYRFSPGHPDGAELADAQRFGEKVGALGCPDASDVLQKPDPATHWMYALERAAASPWLVRLLYSRAFHAEEMLCTRCGRCAHICPTRNISWQKGIIPTWGRDCIFCLMCAETCPVGAVAAPLEYGVFRPFLRYNVRRALRDPAIEHVAVDSPRGLVIGSIKRKSRRGG